MSPLLASLAYSLGQAGLGWVLLQGLNWLIPAARPDLRYRAALGCLLLVVAAWAGMWWHESHPSGRPVVVGAAAPAPSFQREVTIVHAATLTSENREPQGISWPQAVVLLWQAGVAFGFGRMAWSVRRAKRIAADSIPVTEPAWKEALREIGQAMGRRLAVALRASTQLASPVVVGLLHPTIILPARVLTGAPPAVIKATLAHEIAHVLRWDYLVNLIQMAIEAVLFFNPFVWLIGRAVRREREACCDQWASQLCEDPVQYAEALLWWGERSGQVPSAAVGIGGGRSTLRGRIARLLGREIPLSGPQWWGAAGVASLIPFFLLLSTLVVHTALAEFTPEQRVALIAHLTDPFRPNHLDDAPPEKLEKFSGTVVDDEGRAVAGVKWVAIASLWNSTSAGQAGPDGKYAGTAPRGLFTLIIQAPEWAPAMVRYETGASRENGTITLSRGHEFRLRCVDESGAPIPGTRVRAESNDIPYWSSLATTNADGWATLKHLPKLHHGALTFDAPSFQTARRSDTDFSDEALANPIILARVEPAVIRVEDEITGEPVPGVSLRICGVQPQGASFVYPNWGVGGATTNRDGVAFLESLNPDLRYDMKAEGTNRAMTFQFSPRDGMSRTIRLPRERVLDLKFRHFPDGPLTFQYSQNDTEHSANAHSATIEVANGEAQISLKGLMPKMVDLYVLKQWVKSLELKAEKSELVIDYGKIRPAPLVHIVLKANAGWGQAPPTGAYWINWAPKEDSGTWDGLSVPIRQGVAEFDLPQGSYFELKNGELLGGKVDENHRYHALDNPSEFEVPITPAGIIRVKLQEADGRLVSNSFIEAQDVTETKGRRIEIKNSASPGDAQEWFVSEPVALGTTKYHVLANLNMRYAVSAPFRMSAANPIQDIVLTMPKSRTISFRVVDQAGNALGGTTLWPAIEIPGGHKFPGLSIVTDANGIARLEVGKNDPGKISVRPMSEVLIPRTYPVEFSSAGEATVVVEKGKTIRGRLVDHSTGGAGCTVAWTVPSGEMWSDRQTLGPDGTFEFNNVPDQEVFLSTGTPVGKAVVGETTVRPGGSEVVLELKDSAPAR